ncbi:SusC/RagA family TonB-linked outer membrane protein [Sediminitomix flava]|nr:TonB-dependent receptor [Sediminitomix flava]
MKIKQHVNWRTKLQKLVLVSLLMTCLGAVYGQEVIISGTVSDNEFSLPGVNVSVKGTSSGTITDMEGRYKLNVAKGDVLVFSYVGYLSKEVEVGNSTVIDVSLEQDVEILDQVVVIGYGTQTKKEVTGAVNNVSAEALNNVPTSDLGASIQGAVAGVNVQASSGAPGQQANIQIRGVGSLTGSRDPLYVVDGIPYESNPNIAPSQIKSIDILKDGASAAVYGVRASNGVILITTKSGEQGKVKVDFTSWGGIQNITSGTELMNTHEQFYYDQVRSRALGIESTVLDVNPRALENDTDFIAAIQNDNAAIQNYEVNVSSGKGDMTLNANMNYFSQEGILINSNFDRLATRLTGQINKEKFKMFASIGFQNEERHREPWALYEQALRQPPWNTAIEDLPTNGDIIQIPDQNEITYSYLSGILSNTDIENVRRFNVAVNASYELVKGLTFRVRAGSNIQNSKRVQFQPKYLIYDFKGNYNPTASRPQARQEENYVWNERNTLENILSYDKSFGDHNFNVTAAYSLEKYVSENAGIEGVHSPNGNNDIQELGALTSTGNATGFKYVRSLVGMMGRFQYNYKRKYMVSASLRRDGTSQFSEANRFKTFPGVSVGWNIDQEDFWNVPFMNGLKFRASYAQLGNNRIGANPYQAIPVIEQGVNYIYGKEGELTSGLISRQFANQNLLWETSISTNIGLDMAFFDNKLQFTADVYQSDKDNMILGYQLPPSLGASITRPDYEIASYRAVTVNAGNMTNKGLELSLTYRNETPYGLKYSLGATFTKNRNEVTDLNGTERGFGGGRPSLTHSWMDQTTFFAVGHEAGSFFLVKTDGIIKTEEELAEYRQINPNAILGDVKYVDQLTVDTNGDGIPDSGDGKIDDNDRVYMGSGQADFESGMQLSLDYKGFDFFIQGYYSYGAEIFNGARLYAYAEGRHKELLGMWSPQNPNSDIPVAVDRQSENVRAYSDLWLEDGTYFRIRTLTLGYNFQKYVSGMGISKARLYLSAVNPFTFTKYTGYDPEVGGDGLSLRGVDRGNYPVSRQFLIGAQLSF